MEKKYIIKLEDDELAYQTIIINGMPYIKPLRLLPYTEPEDYPKQAYTDTLRMDVYCKGLSDAWEAAKKLARMDTETSENVTGYFGLFRIMENLTPMQAIEKIRQYEQEKRFCVGDEFENETGKRFVILKMDGTEIERYMDWEGKTYCMIAKYKVIRKTGRHFPEIAEVLRKMKETECSV